MECARREALEEAGVRLGVMTHIGQIWSIPSISTETIDYYLAEYQATDRIEAGGGHPDEQENITVHEWPLDQLWTTLAQGQMGDAKLVMLTQALRLRRPELFTVPVA